MDTLFVYMVCRVCKQVLKMNGGVVKCCAMKPSDIEQLFLDAKRVSQHNLKYDNGLLTFDIVLDNQTYEVQTAIKRFEPKKRPRGKSPWVSDPGWLRREYKKYGSFAAIAEANNLPEEAGKAMNTYAVQVLNWNIGKVYQAKNLEFIDMYFGTPKEKRLSLRKVATKLGIPVSTAALWKSEYESGKRVEALTDEEHNEIAAIEDLIFPENVVRRKKHRAS
jgi:hypothetical protein